MSTDLKDALSTVRTILRQAGLQHLAAQVPVQKADDPQAVLERIEILDGLMKLNPPGPEAQKKLEGPWKALVDRIEGLL